MVAPLRSLCGRWSARHDGPAIDPGGRRLPHQGTI